MDNQEFKPYAHDKIMGDYYKHPTFGVVYAARGQGSSHALFGSSVKHSNTIHLSISHAELCRGLNSDHIFNRETIVEVEMSATQFADMITGLNVGCGTPCTLRFIAGGERQNLHRVDPPYQNKVEQFNDEFAQDMKDLSTRFDSIIALANETHAQKRLIKEIELLKGSIANNIPFVAEQFSEQMQKTVTEAKGEIEAFITHTVQSYGIEAIRKQAPQLPEATNAPETTRLIEEQ